jgi:hypothetical protein
MNTEVAHFVHFDADKVRPALILSSLKKYSEDTENILIKQSASNVICSKVATVSEKYDT